MQLGELNRESCRAVRFGHRSLKRTPSCPKMHPPLLCASPSGCRNLKYVENTEKILKQCFKTNSRVTFVI